MPCSAVYPFSSKAGPGVALDALGSRAHVLEAAPVSGFDVEDWTLRVEGDGRVLALVDGAWTPAPLRKLAKRYAVGEGPWPWLRSHGIRRPSPSGRSMPEERTRRDGLRVRIGAAASERARTLASSWGCSVAEAVERALVIGSFGPRPLRPFWTYYGGKWRSAPRYPAPEHDTIVEPFAGSAGYALRYWDRRVVLVEKDPVIAGIWRYLLRARPSEIRSIPLLGLDQTVDDLGPVAEEAKLLVGFWLRTGSETPRSRPSPWMKEGRWPHRFWGERARERIARQVELVRHWRIIEGGYRRAPDIRATWFVDPPYQKAGASYRHGSSRLNYSRLGGWVRSRKGLVIACENEGATWLPFEPFFVSASNMTNGQRQVSREAIWVQRSG